MEVGGPVPTVEASPGAKFVEGGTVLCTKGVFIHFLLYLFERIFDFIGLVVFFVWSALFFTNAAVFCDLLDEGDVSNDQSRGIAGCMGTTYTALTGLQLYFAFCVFVGSYRMLRVQDLAWYWIFLMPLTFFFFPIAIGALSIGITARLKRGHEVPKTVVYNVHSLAIKPAFSALIVFLWIISSSIVEYAIEALWTVVFFYLGSAVIAALQMAFHGNVSSEHSTAQGIMGQELLGKEGGYTYQGNPALTRVNPRGGADSDSTDHTRARTEPSRVAMYTLKSIGPSRERMTKHLASSAGKGSKVDIDRKFGEAFIATVTLPGGEVIRVCYRGEDLGEDGKVRLLGALASHLEIDQFLAVSPLVRTAHECVGFPPTPDGTAITEASLMGPGPVAVFLRALAAETWGLFYAAPFAMYDKNGKVMAGNPFTVGGPAVPVGAAPAPVTVLTSTVTDSCPPEDQPAASRRSLSLQALSAVNVRDPLVPFRTANSLPLLHERGYKVRSVEEIARRAAVLVAVSIPSDFPVADQLPKLLKRYDLWKKEVTAQEREGFESNDKKPWRLEAVEVLMWALSVDGAVVTVPAHQCSIGSVTGFDFQAYMSRKRFKDWVESLNGGRGVTLRAKEDLLAGRDLMYCALNGTRQAHLELGGSHMVERAGISEERLRAFNWLLYKEGSDVVWEDTDVSS